MMRQRYFHLRATRYGGQVVVAVMTSLLANAWTAAAQGGCPSANINDVMKDPRVQEEMADAWNDSHEGQPDEHEEGGWIYQCRMPNGDGTFRYYTQVLRWAPGSVDGISPTPPLAGDAACRLVADFHTHPGGGRTGAGRPDNPSDDGATNWEPSGADLLASAESGVPGIIRFGSGTETTDIPYGYNGIEEPTDPGWTCPGAEASDGWGTGEPHVKTLDGYAYDFQAIGTFTYLASARNDFEIQVQQQAYRSLRYVSFNSAVAVRDGADRIEWSIDRPDPLLNGVARPMAEGSEVKLRSRGILRRTPEGYLFVSSAGDRLIVVASTEMVDFYLRPARHRRGKVRGLLGNFDGDVDNDMTTADGRLIAVSTGVMDFYHPLYSQFGASWRVPTESLLITRALPAAPDPRAFPEREPAVADPAMAAARAICDAAGVTDAEIREACAFDLAATGNEAFVRSAARTNREAITRRQAVGTPLAVNAEATGKIDGREARVIYTITLAPGTYLFDGSDSEQTSWTVAAPDGTLLLNAEQSRWMEKAAPARVTIATAGTYRITVSVRAEMLDGSYLFRVSPVP